MKLSELKTFVAIDLNTVQNEAAHVSEHDAHFDDNEDYTNVYSGALYRPKRVPIDFRNVIVLVFFPSEIYVRVLLNALVASCLSSFRRHRRMLFCGGEGRDCFHVTQQFARCYRPGVFICQEQEQKKKR